MYVHIVCKDTGKHLLKFSKLSQGNKYITLKVNNRIMYIIAQIFFLHKHFPETNCLFSLIYYVCLNEVGTIRVWIKDNILPTEEGIAPRIFLLY